MSKGNGLNNFIGLSSVGCLTPRDLDFRWDTRSEVVPELLGPMKKDLNLIPKEESSSVLLLLGQKLRTVVFSAASGLWSAFAHTEGIVPSSRLLCCDKNRSSRGRKEPSEHSWGGGLADTVVDHRPAGLSAARHRSTLAVQPNCILIQV